MGGGGGEFPLWIYFFLCGQSFLSTWGPCHFFRVGGGLIFCMGEGIIGLAPHNNFCGSLLLSQIFIILQDRGGLNFFEGAIRSVQKTCPPPAPAPIKINNHCPPPHSQYFSFSHYYHYPITPPRPCMLPEKQSKCAQKLTTLS